MDDITLTNLHAVWVANNLISNSKTLYRIDGHGERFYYSLDEDLNPRFYGSVTSIKKQVTGLPQGVIDKRVEMGDQAFWAYTNNKAHFGTFWHTQAAELTQNGKYPLGQLRKRINDYAAAHPDCGDTSWWFKQAWKGLLSWLQCMKDYDIRPVAIEIPLAHPDGYAGTIDLVCVMNDKKYTNKTPVEDRKRVYAIIDWKTGYIYEDHAFQLELNKKCFEENFASTGINISVIYNFSPNDWRSNPTYQLKNQSGTKYEELTPLYVNLWQKVGHKKPPNVFKPIDEISLDDQVGFSSVTIEDFIRNKHLEEKDAI